jgi:hypothetical protein
LSLLSAAKQENNNDNPVKTGAIDTGNMYGHKQNQIKGRGIVQSQEQENREGVYTRTRVGKKRKGSGQGLGYEE